MKKRLLCVLFGAILLSSSALALDRFHFGLSVGTSKLIGSDSNYWTGGFNFSGKVAYELSPSFHLGASIAYQSVSPNMSAIEKYLDDDEFSGSFSRSYVEFIPYIAFYPNGNGGGLFLQAGAGLVLSLGTINVHEVNYYNYLGFITTYDYNKKLSNLCPAAMLGGGFRFPIGGKLSIEVKIEGRFVATPAEGYPLGTKEIWAGSNHKYFSLGVGLLY